MRIETGFTADVISRCVDMHSGFYARAHGFGKVFTDGVTQGLMEFCSRLEKPCNQVWRAVDGERIVGTIFIDGEDLGPGLGHLRWFIVEDGLQGQGLGKQLMTAAMAFCDTQKFTETHLRTFRGLDAARALYDRHGFKLADEQPGSQWGKEVMVQHFVR